jgi:hypothetical protein
MCILSEGDATNQQCKAMSHEEKILLLFKAFSRDKGVPKL